MHQVHTHSTRLAIFVATLGALASRPEPAHAAGNVDDLADVANYAVGCFEKLHIDEAALKAANGGAADLDCKHADAFKLKTTWTKKAGDPAPTDCDPTCDLDVWATNNPANTTPWPGTTANPRAAAPPLCDYPAWLDAGATTPKPACYGNTYVRRLDMTTTQKETVQAVLLCRHKRVFGENGDTTFDDIAMIVHNNTNGNTCWFQAPQGTGVQMDGRHVPYPTTAGKTCARPAPANPCWENGTCTCWDPPKEIADTHDCISCHDNGPFMRSYWMNQAKVGNVPVVPRDVGPYRSPGAAFTNFKAAFLFVKNDDTCTDCHHIGAGRRTCSKWVYWVTNGGPAHDATLLPPQSSEWAKQWTASGWMPSDRTTGLIPASAMAKWDTPAKWDTDNKTEVQDLIDCCADPTNAKCKKVVACAGGAPFGPGTATACLPPDEPTGPITKCEDGIAKTVAKLVKAIDKCHDHAAATATDDEACEQAATAKFLTTKTTGCDPCTDLATLAVTVESRLNADNQILYCASSATPAGSDETGFVPPDAPSGPVAKCEAKVSKAASKVVRQYLVCELKEAAGRFPTVDGETACEETAAGKFMATKTDGCDACTDLTAVHAAQTGLLDEVNSLIYCAE